MYNSAPDHREDGRVLVLRRWCGRLVKEVGPATIVPNAADPIMAGG